MVGIGNSLIMQPLKDGWKRCYSWIVLWAQSCSGKRPALHCVDLARAITVIITRSAVCHSVPNTIRRPVFGRRFEAFKNMVIIVSMMDVVRKKSPPEWCPPEWCPSTSVGVNHSGVPGRD